MPPMPMGMFIKAAASAAGVLFLVILIQHGLERLFRFDSLIPEQLREERGKAWFALLLAVEVILYAVAPTFFYFWIYAILPLFSYRAGVGAAMFLYGFGTLPFAVGLALRMKLPGGVLMFLLFFNLLKLAACWGIVTWMLNS